MMDWIRFGLAEGDWCNDFLTPPHMPEQLGFVLTRLSGCAGSGLGSLLVIGLLAMAIVIGIHRHDLFRPRVDPVAEALRSGFIGTDATAEFFRSRDKGE